MDAKLTRALKIVPDSIRDMEKGDAILCEADMILLDYLIEICGMIIDLAPSKEVTTPSPKGDGFSGNGNHCSR